MQHLISYNTVMTAVRSRASRTDHLFGFASEIIQRVSRDHLPVAAAAISFFTVISFVPLLLFGILIAVNFLNMDQLTRDIAPLQSTLGPRIAESIAEQVKFVISNKQLLAIAVLILGAWTGSQVFLMLESAINMVWRSRARRSFWHRRVLSVGMVLIVGTLMIGAAALINMIRIFSKFQLPLLGYHVGQVPWLLTTLISGVVPVLLVSAIFAVIYYILPTRKVTFHSVVPGAVAAAIFWSVSLNLFGWYATATHFDGYYFLYGSLGGFIFLMFWLYYSALIMLVGAEVSAVFHQHLVAAGDQQERQVEDEEAKLPEPAAETDGFF